MHSEGNAATLQILKSVKAGTEVRNSVSHSAIIFANALMHCGTTVDSFLRDNLDWLSRATNWAKFSATAGLGVIHRGHLSQARWLMLSLVLLRLSHVVWPTGLSSARPRGWASSTAATSARRADAALSSCLGLSHLVWVSARCERPKPSADN